jgi:hypothetical protein
MFSALYNKITDTDIRKKLWDPTGKNTVDFLFQLLRSTDLHTILRNLEWLMQLKYR